MTMGVAANDTMMVPTVAPGDLAARERLRRVLDGVCTTVFDDPCVEARRVESSGNEGHGGVGSDTRPPRLPSRRSVCAGRAVAVAPQPGSAWLSVGAEGRGPDLGSSVLSACRRRHGQLAALATPSPCADRVSAPDAGGVDDR